MGLRTGNCSIHSDAKLVPATSSPLYVHFFGLARRAECLIHTAAEYDSKASLTPYRLDALFSEEKPAELWYLGAVPNNGWIVTLETEGEARFRSPTHNPGTWKLSVTYEPR